MMRLAGFLIFALMVYRWIRKHSGAPRKWEKLIAAGAEAEKRGDLEAAGNALNDADALAARQSGVLWRRRLALTKAPLARVLFRTGQLERSAALVFDLLEHSHGTT
ncbi:MAG: hypothetical protein M3O35_08580 [Acidobacteriota bacterium]|nr:hypothetical protein [Acidobacteriota bacterium]